MREIKFRAWDKKEKCWYYNVFIAESTVWISIEGDGEKAIIVPRKDLIPVAYTNFQDKNGKEIWKGDIFKWSLPKGFKTAGSEPFPELAELLNCERGALSENITEIAIVEWDEKRGLWKLLGQGENLGWESALGGEFVDGSHRNKHGEVIGNIYENPGLFEKFNNEKN